MSKLSVVNSFDIAVNGVKYSSRQGLPSESSPYSFDISSVVAAVETTVASSSVVQIYNSSYIPGSFKYLHFWSDKGVYVQLSSSSNGVIVKMIPYVPFVWQNGSVAFLASAMTTEPSLASVTSVRVGNWTGELASVRLFLLG